MCGIAGMILPTSREVAPERLERMTRALEHRGPDGEGYFRHRHVGLGHRRLSIIDLSGGWQPLYNEDGSIAVICNGEIYNYRELMAELEAKGHKFKTKSDCEVLAHLYEEHGIDMLQRLRGMFAIALYDRNRDKLFLARDRFGIKPLYYARIDGAFYFASEIKPFFEIGYRTEVNPEGLHAYFKSRFAHTDETLFKGIHRLPEGTFLETTPDAGFTLTSYYPNPRITGDLEGDDFFERFEAAVRDAISTEMVADVPVGAYLSGGIDSSVLVSQMVELTGKPVQTFCVDFEHGFTEGSLAAETARRLGCVHHEVKCGVDELLQLPSVVATLEEPVGDPIVVAGYFLSKLTRDKGIKTILTGDGADEILGGYQYLRVNMLAARNAQWIPHAILEKVAPALIEACPPPLLKLLADLPFDVAPEAKRRASRLFSLAAKGDIRGIYDLLLSLHLDEDLEEIYAPQFRERVRSMPPPESFAGLPNGTGLGEQVLSLQYRKWLPANINLKQDRLCMAHAIENRVPFLDVKLVELMARMPMNQKIRGRTSKFLLRELAKKRLGGALAGRRKVPFHFPVQHFLKDKRVTEFIVDNLDSMAAKRAWLVRPEYLSFLRKKLAQDDFIFAKKVFMLVIIELWFRTFVDNELTKS